MREYGSQAVVWQTAINPVVALELLAGGTWSGTGVLGPEAFAPRPFLDLLTAYGSPWGQPRRAASSAATLAEVASTGPVTAATHRMVLIWCRVHGRAASA